LVCFHCEEEVGPLLRELGRKTVSWGMKARRPGSDAVEIHRGKQLPRQYGTLGETSRVSLGGLGNGHTQGLGR